MHGAADDLSLFLFLCLGVMCIIGAELQFETMSKEENR